MANARGTDRIQGCRDSEREEDCPLGFDQRTAVHLTDMLAGWARLRNTLLVAVVAVVVSSVVSSVVQLVRLEARLRELTQPPSVHAVPGHASASTPAAISMETANNDRH